MTLLFKNASKQISSISLYLTKRKIRPMKNILYLEKQINNNPNIFNAVIKQLEKNMTKLPVQLNTKPSKKLLDLFNSAYPFEQSKKDTLYAASKLSREFAEEKELPRYLSRANIQNLIEKNLITGDIKYDKTGKILESNVNMDIIIPLTISFNTADLLVRERVLNKSDKNVYTFTGLGRKQGNTEYENILDGVITVINLLKETLPEKYHKDLMDSLGLTK